jgi:hypothetical protein
VTIFARIAKKNAQKIGLKATCLLEEKMTSAIIITAMKNEDSFEMAGVTYHAIHRKTCIGCSFEFSDYCIFDDDQPYCMSSMRIDGQDIIWQREAIG